MARVRIAFRIALNNFKKWGINPRIYIILIMLIAYLHSRLSPINTFCSTFEYKITPYIFSFLMSEENTVLLIMLGVVLLFCDAPFIESEQPYIITRSGRGLWVLGQILYIIIASAIYFIVINIISIIILLPNLELSTEWGKVIGTFAQTSIAQSNNITIPFSISIYNSYTPIQSTAISFILCWFVAAFLGILMFVLNLNISRSAGAILASLLVLWQSVIAKTSTVYTNFSPISWVSLSKIDVNGTTLYPTLSYIFVMISLFFVLLTIISFFSIRKRDIDILKSV